MSAAVGISFSSEVLNAQGNLGKKNKKLTTCKNPINQVAYPSSSSNDVLLEYSKNNSVLKNEKNGLNETSVPAAVHSGEIQIDNGDFQKNNQRSKTPRSGNWKDIKNKIARMEGKTYYSRGPEGIKRKAKKIGASCNSTFCRKSSQRHCHLFTTEIRQELFTNYWTNMDWSQKRVYVRSLVDVVPIKQKRTLEVSRRNQSCAYFLKCESQRHQVCQKMFQSTLGIKQKQIQYWLKNNVEHQTRKKNSYRSQFLPKNIPESKMQSKNHLQDFLMTLPKLPSHYCRRKTKKLYLEPNFQSKRQLFQFYKDNCIEHGKQPSSLFNFNEMFEKMNIGLFKLKSDQCDTCCSYKAKQISEETWKMHISNKNIARESKTSDKKDAMNGLCHVVTMDVQSVKLTPDLKASALYRKRKMISHNFSIYDVKDHASKIYWWDEVQGDLSASTFASCVIDFLSRYEDNLPIIIFSDGCGYQYRNARMSNALLLFAVKTGKVIYQKFLEKGHSQMEVDSVHRCIETELKNKEVFIPSEYIAHCKAAREIPFPYEASYLQHDFFTDFSIEKLQIYTSIRPGEKPGDPCVTDIRALKYLPVGTIEYKLCYEKEWVNLPRNPNNVNTPLEEFPKLFAAPRPITACKWKDLQELKHIMPSKYHAFYDSIPHK